MTEPKAPTREGRITQLREQLKALPPPLPPWAPDHDKVAAAFEREKLMREILELTSGVDSLRLAGGVDVNG